MKHLVVTSVNSPTASMIALSDLCARRNISFHVIGDLRSPEKFDLPNAKFYTLEQQRKLPFNYSSVCPVGHYARKNIGYLLAFSEGADTVFETDDDNKPYDCFFDPFPEKLSVRRVDEPGWVNVYKLFTDRNVWPRGLPLDYISRSTTHSFEKIDNSVSPIMQGLADGDPDVDAIFRLVLNEEIFFKDDQPVFLAPGSWCPFNSQNTRWSKTVFPLMYLPFSCSFRMTDIWRSFVALAILHKNNMGITFHRATVFQDRNVHNFLKDFEDEISGYLGNSRMVEILHSIDLKVGRNYFMDNMFKCYDVLIEHGFFDTNERNLLSKWADDLDRLGVL